MPQQIGLIGLAVMGENLARNGVDRTHHALDHGYFDSAHFSRTWRGLFGVTPSSVVRGLEGPMGARIDR